MQMMRQTLLRLAKGEFGMRLEVWRRRATVDAFAAHRRAQQRLEERMRRQMHQAGLRTLRQVMAGMVHGEEDGQSMGASVCTRIAAVDAE